MGWPEAYDRFRAHDESMLRAQFQIRDDEAQLIQNSRDALAELQQIFEADELEPKSETVRDEARERADPQRD